MTPLDQRPAEAPGRAAPSGPAPFAALDLGTNNCRLLIAQTRKDGFRVVEAFSRVVRLGEGLHDTGRISDHAMDRAVDALRICASKMRRRSVRKARCVATEACRRAENAGDFLARASTEAGVELEVIDPAEEARLAVVGCGPLFARDAPYALVFDIGGGSTELSWVDLSGARPKLIDWVSFPLGVVALTERYGGDRVSADSYAAMVDEAAAAAAPFAERNAVAAHVAAGDAQIVGTSGTVTTLAGVHMGLPRYDRAAVDGRWLPFDAALDIAHQLARADRAERATFGCVGRERADLVVAGCAIMEAVHRIAPGESLRVGDRGLREGILFDFARRRRRRRRRRKPPA